MSLPAYVQDEEILLKLHSWGVAAVSAAAVWGKENLASKAVIAGAEPGREMDAVMAPHLTPEAGGLAPPQSQIPKPNRSREADRGREPVRGGDNGEKSRSRSQRDRGTHTRWNAETIPVGKTGVQPAPAHAQASLIPAPQRPVSASTYEPAITSANFYLLDEASMDFSSISQEQNQVDRGGAKNLKKKK